MYFDWNNRSCATCPINFDCMPSAQIAPRVQNGYYPVAFGGVSIGIRCRISGSCQDVNGVFICAPGRNRSSFLCSQCNQGYYSPSSSPACLSCQNWTVSLTLSIVSAFILLTLVAWYCKIMYFSNENQAQEHDVESMRSKRYMTLDLTIFWFQVNQ